MRRLTLALLIALVPAVARAVVARDQTSALSGPCTSSTSCTFTCTPSGTPRGVVVQIVQLGGPDQVTGITYGSTGMTETTDSPHVANPGEGGAIYTYFLGASVPAGSQTVTISVDTGGAGASAKYAACTTLTAGANTEVVDTVAISGLAANPSGTVLSSSRSVYAQEAGLSGHTAPTSVTALSGWTKIGIADQGSVQPYVLHYDTVGTSNVTIGWTAVSDDYVITAISVAEVAGGPQTYNESITETITLTESLATTFIGPNAVSESITLTDSMPGGKQTSDAVTEAITLADSMASAKTTSASFTESILLDDSLTSTFVAANVMSESITLLDSVVDNYIPGGGGGTLYEESITESVSLVDILASTATYPALLTEPVTLIDGMVGAAVYAHDFSEAITLLDDLVSTLTCNNALLEIITLEDLMPGGVRTHDAIIEVLNLLDCPDCPVCPPDQGGTFRSGGTLRR